MIEYIIISIEPAEDDYNTIPHFRIYDRNDFINNDFREGTRSIASIFRNGDAWEFLRGNKEPTFDEPDAVVEVISDDDVSEVKRISRQFLDPSAQFFRPELVLQPA
jgi:hypothetical protein